jgi:hypothetical protein
MVSMADGRATTYAIWSLQDRGTFFTHPGQDVYSGMIVGEYTRDGDLDVNPCKEKKLTNVRSVEADEKMHLSPPRVSGTQDSGQMPAMSCLFRPLRVPLTCCLPDSEVADERACTVASCQSPAVG